jgi:hypothetical protein
MSQLCRVSAGRHESVAAARREEVLSQKGEGRERSYESWIAFPIGGRLELPSNALLEVSLQEHLGRIRRALW